MNPFETFLDTEDLTACVDAADSPAALNARAEPRGCVWPLWLEPDQSFGELFQTIRATPRGFRHGFIGDNVLGLQWRLPSARELRLGGRVMKNVTGFDLVRFFSASRGRFGEPLKLVLRLRPADDTRLDLRLEGDWPALKGLARAVRSDAWSHALDTCDLRAEAGAAALHLGFAAKAELLPLFRHRALDWAQTYGLRISETSGEAPAQARPWARAQAPLDDCVDLAQAWIERHGGSVHALLGQGVLQLQNPGAPQDAERGLHELHRRLGEQGGHCEHPCLQPDEDCAPARWERELLARLERIA